MLKLPRSSVDPKEIEPYCVERVFSMEANKDHVLLDIQNAARAPYLRSYLLPLVAAPPRVSRAHHSVRQERPAGRAATARERRMSPRPPPFRDVVSRRPGKRARARLSSESEPSYEDAEEVVEWGGQRIWAVDFTSGGAPIGLTIEELREMTARDLHRAGWARAKHVLEMVFAKYGRVEVGRVRKIGEGSSHEVFAAFVEVEPDRSGQTGVYAVFLPPRGSDAKERPDPWREAALLDRVAAGTQMIRVPTVTATVPTTGGHAVVRPYLEGIPLDLRAGHQTSVRPWEIVAHVAAAIHSIESIGVAGLRGHETRRAHAASEISVLQGLPELSEAERWALAHLPEEEPATLIHGDLLGQNILLHPDKPPGVIDWEYAMRGDPAYDLAIVTRGVRRPFQIERGLGRLLDAYAASGLRRIAAAAVHVYELCLAGRWYRDALEDTSRRELPEQALRRVQNILCRARGV
jgi:aminoglycoside phosphotransferase (APT) family kinase protein